MSASRLFFLILAVLLLAGLAVHPAHPHFEAEILFGFWPFFGLAGGVMLAVAAGAMLGPLTRFTETDHDR